MSERLRILTWHVHGSYLYYLVQEDRHDYILPMKPGRPVGYGARSGTLSWPENVHEVHAEDVHRLQFDAVLFQSRRNYREDQFEILSEGQRRLPRIYLEHDPPREHPTDTRHPAADDEGTLIAHVTAFNHLMWDNGAAASRVIEHGVTLPAGAKYTGDLARGLAIVNGLPSRGRRLGLDIFERVRKEVPIDLVGMESEQIGGLGEIPHHSLATFAGQYRFLFNPIRYTSLGLAVCEAMLLGMPVVGLATTEMSTVIKSGVSGYIDTDPEALIPHMQRLLANRDEAIRIGAAAREVASRRFSVQRFLDDWDEAWTEAASIASRHASLATGNGA